jgi:hypothetical protein
MVTIGFRIPQGALEACRKQIESKLARVVADVAVKTYNNLLHQDFPYWSGSYISSWNISAGSPDTNYNTPLWTRGVYIAPRESRGITVPSAYTKVYISNYTPHASLVEYSGTKTSNFQPWYIATSARNNTVLTYKYKMF